MEKRLKRLYKDGFGVVLWLMTDDDGGWNKTLASNFSNYVNDIKELGWFNYASIIVLGLELNEYWNVNQVAAGINSIHGAYSGMVGIHMTSGKYDWAGMADILFYQTQPGKSAAQIENETKTVISKTNNKPMCFFELSRTEDRALCEAALRGGAFSVGNW